MGTCTKDLGGGSGASPRPVFGPEMVSLGLGFAVGVTLGLFDVSQKLTPDQKIAMGAALLFVVVPTLAALAGALVPGVPPASVALVGVVSELAEFGLVVLVTGIQEKTKEPATEPQPTEPTTPGDPGPEPSDTGGRPDPGADPAPNSCMRAIARLTSCFGQRDPCEDPQLAAELKAARDRACKREIAYVDPDSDFCRGQKASEEEIANALVGACIKAMRDKHPVPGESPCPLMYGAGSGSLANSIPKVCTQVMGDTVTCPTQGGPNTPGPFLPPVCPRGAGSGVRDCGPFPEVFRRP